MASIHELRSWSPSTVSPLLANTTLADGSGIIGGDGLEQPSVWQTCKLRKKKNSNLIFFCAIKTIFSPFAWCYGMIVITISAVASPIGILLVPLLAKNLYDRCMVFLVALGIGAMSGSCLFILLPHVC